MFWVVVLTTTVLAGLAYDVISCSLSKERIVIGINFGKLTSAIRILRDAAYGHSESHSRRESRH
jgi:hypothetical protein